MSKIEWLHLPGYKPETWNPVTGCSKVSRGCKHCYALTMSRRLQGIQSAKEKYEGTVSGSSWTGVVKTHPKELKRPATWRKPRMVFVNSMSDLFHEGVSFAFQLAVFDVMRKHPQHIFLILTKRPIRMRVIVNRIMGHYHSDMKDGLSNVALGVSAEDQATANERIPPLLQTTAAIRFVSCEPLVGEIDLQRIVVETWQGGKEVFLKSLERDGPTNISTLDWVIAGGESGAKAEQPMHPDWVRALRDQCAAAGVPFFFKQWGKWLPFGQQNSEGYIKISLSGFGEKSKLFEKTSKKIKAGQTLDGVTHTNWPWPARQPSPTRQPKT